jgi:hypothetical protein
MVTEADSCKCANSVLEEEKPIMSRLVVALALALAATTATAQDAPHKQSQNPAAPSTGGTQPFLFDGRMKGGGVRQREQMEKRHTNAGAIVRPKASQPERK